MNKQYYSLNGEWDLYWDDGLRGGKKYWPDTQHSSHKKWKATVPGEVHLDLMRQGVLDDIYTDLHIYKARWVEEFFWGYRRKFDRPAESFQASRIFLNFAGLDYAAQIFLNGELIGTHQNYFLPLQIEITDKIKETDNDLLVILESGLYSAAEKPVSPYKDANGCPDFFLHKRIWMRKPQNSFGWDWSPRLLNVGLHGDVTVTWDQGISIRESSVHTLLDETLEDGSVWVKLKADTLCAQKITVQITLWDKDTPIRTIQKEVPFSPDHSEQKIGFSVSNPQLWYPVGYGEAYLYRLEIEAKQGTERIWCRVSKIGFRHIKINQQVHPQQGHYFYFMVNGIPVFAKGANLVPADIIYQKISRNKYESLIEKALECNMNFIRVWGGGIYESDEFYDLCDITALVVWKEFIIAGATYPVTNENFTANVLQEAKFQINRLSGHPSLAAWCGNNEIEWGVQNLPGGELFSDYALYHALLPAILQQEAPEYYYQPSSPYSSFSHLTMNYTEGDQHPWEVGINEHDFWKYRGLCCRFPNEGGFMGPNGLKTLRQFLGENQAYLHSPAFEVHDNMLGDFTPISSPDHALKLWLDIEASELCLEDYVYWGGFLQGEALTEYITNFRRQKFDCGAAVFWMFNDIWPASRSWSIVDYYVRRTPAFYPVKRSFAPVIVCAAREGDRIKIYGVNDLLTDWSGDLVYGLCSSSGYALKETIPVTIPANSSALLTEFTLQEDFSETKQLPFGWLLQNGKIISRHRQLQVRYFEFQFQEKTIQATQEKNILRLKSEGLFLGVCLDLSGEMTVSDNYFDLYPGQEYTVVLPPNHDSSLSLHYQLHDEKRVMVIPLKQS